MASQPTPPPGLARATYENGAGNTFGDPGSFVNTFLQAYGSSAAGGQFPTQSASGSSLAGTVRTTDNVYVNSPYSPATVQKQVDVSGRLVPVTTPGSPGYTQLTADQAYNAMIAGGPNDITRVQNQLVAAGYLQPGAYIPGIADGATKDAYRQLLQDGADEVAAGKTTTLDQILNQRAKALQANGGPNGPNSGAFTGTRTTTSTDSRVTLTNPSQARAYAEQTLGDLLGRQPTTEEFHQYLASLHAAERANPSTATTTTSSTYKGGIQTGSHSNVVENQGGADPQMLAESYAYQHHGDEVAQTGLLTLLDSFRKLVDGGANG